MIVNKQRSITEVNVQSWREINEEKLLKGLIGRTRGSAALKKETTRLDRRITALSLLLLLTHSKNFGAAIIFCITGNVRFY